MSSRIEQLIDEIEEYIDSCKYQAFSSNKILVNKDEIEELIRELRVKTPDEIKRYQRIIQNKEEILNDARAKAEQLIKDTTVQRTELISEHQIMQQAYAQADEVVSAASRQAQEILDKATNDANSIRLGAMQYTDDILRNLESAISHSIDSAKARHESYLSTLQGFLDVVTTNRAELNTNADEPAGRGADDLDDELPKVEITSDML